MGVRVEKVVLSLEDNFTTTAAKAAAVTALLNRELKSVSGVSTTASGSSQSLGKEVDRLSGRVRILVDAAAMLGPALVPIGAIAVPALTGLAAQFGFTAAAAGGMIVGLQGVGDALEAVNEARFAPTAANLAKAREQMEKISPAARDLVRQLADLNSVWGDLKDTASTALAPGLSEALDSLVERAPEAERILSEINSTMGEMLADGAESLASPRWDDFFDFIVTDAPPALRDMGTALGDIAHAMSELWMAFDPLNDGFSTWLVDSARGLDEWASGLAQTDGFAEFVDYIRVNGPRVAALAGAVAEAFLEIAEAAAPIGAATLPVLTKVAEVVSVIADSDLGTPLLMGAAAAAAYRRSTALIGPPVQKLTDDLRTMGQVGVVAWGRSAQETERFNAAAARTRATAIKAAAGATALALASSGLADDVGLSNTAMLGLVGTMGGPWGIAAGTAVGSLMDIKAASDDLAQSVRELADLEIETGNLREAREMVDALRGQVDDVTAVNVGSLRGAATAQLQAYQGAWATLTGTVGDAEDQLAESEAEIDRVSDAASQSSAQMALMSDKTRLASASAESLRLQFIALTEALEGRSSMRAYEQAIDDVAKSLKENGRTLDINTEKGRANEAALDAIASTSLEVAENLTGMDRVEFMGRARRDFIDAAEKLGMTRKQAQELADELGLLNQMNVKPNIDVNTTKAMTDIAALERRLNAISDEDVFINVRHRNVGGDTGMGPQNDGMRVATSGFRSARDAAQAALDALIGARDAYSSQVAGQFSSSLTGGGLAGLLRSLRGDVAGREQMSAGLSRLESMGLSASSGLYKELAASSDARTVTQLASSPAALAEAMRLYEQRGTLNAAAGSAAGESAFGAQIVAQTKVLDDSRALLQQAVRELREANRHAKDAPERTGWAIGDGIDRKTGDAARRGRRQKVKVSD